MISNKYFKGKKILILPRNVDNTFSPQRKKKSLKRTLTLPPIRVPLKTIGLRLPHKANKQLAQMIIYSMQDFFEPRLKYFE